MFLRKTWHRTWDMHLDLHLIHLLLAEVSAEMVSMDGWLSFLRKGKRQKRLSYAKWHKKWTENQWQQVLWRDASSPEPGLQHYWSSVGSSWQRTEQKAANIQRRFTLGRPSRSLENYFWRLLKEITESSSKRVQAVLKNKGAQTKYQRPSLLEFYKLLLYILYLYLNLLISIHCCIYFSFPVNVGCINKYYTVSHKGFATPGSLFLIYIHVTLDIRKSVSTTISHLKG